MADFLDEKRSEMQQRLKELRPLVDEYQRLEAAVSALDGVGAPSASASATGGRTAARRSARGASSNGAGRGRPRGTGTRGKQALELVQGKPGITIPEMAEKMGIHQNYLYRVLPSLQKEGLVRKEGRGWHAAQPAA